jgi:hypothetical protein
MRTITSPLFIGILVLLIGAYWQMFVKAGKPGWAILIPFYNIYVLLQIAGKPGWWLILMFIPFVNIVINLLMSLGLAKAFGKGVGFAIGIFLLPLIFVGILGFGSSTYGDSSDNWRQGIIENQRDVSAVGSPLRITK